jgi:hypothetical protein
MRLLYPFVVLAFGCGIFLFLASGRLPSVGNDRAVAVSSTTVPSSRSVANQASPGYSMAQSKRDTSDAPQREFPTVSIFEKLTHLHAEEARDSSWAETASELLRSVIRRRAGPNTKLTAVDCRASLCRVELSHKTVDEALAFQRLVGLTDARPWNGELFFWTKGVVGGAPPSRDTATDERQVTMFIARQGTPIL